MSGITIFILLTLGDSFLIIQPSLPFPSSLENLLMTVGRSDHHNLPVIYQYCQDNSNLLIASYKWLFYAKFVWKEFLKTIFILLSSWNISVLCWWSLLWWYLIIKIFFANIARIIKLLLKDQFPDKVPCHPCK